MFLTHSVMLKAAECCMIMTAVNLLTPEFSGRSAIWRAHFSGLSALKSPCLNSSLHLILTDG